ncbi:MAG: hypothetical protein K6U02_02370 [Firmicutes bacterium]|nr:hypothetical protein [Bacillota bacterium]
MKILRPRRLTRFTAVALLNGTLLAAQETPPPPAAPVPHEQWLASEDVQQIPWQVQVSPPALSLRQWRVVRVEVRVPSRYLRTHEGRRQFTLVARVADPDGQWLTPPRVDTAQVDSHFVRSSALRFHLPLQVQPGDYQLVLALQDHQTGLRNVRREPLRIAAPGKDPLPDASRHLPRVSFLRSSSIEGVDAELDVPARLWLPVQSERPLRIELLVNFSPSEQFYPSVSVHRQNRGVMLAALDVLSQLHVPNGSLHLIAFDLTHRRVLFEQPIRDRVDWEGLQAALSEIHPLQISREALEHRQQITTFFRELMRERLQRTRAETLVAAEDAATGAIAAEPPQTVFILVSSGILFPSGNSLEPLTQREADECDCRVFYFQFRIHRDNLWDHLTRLLTPFRPQRFFLQSPNDFRRGLARMLSQLRTPPPPPRR